MKVPVRQLIISWQSLSGFVSLAHKEFRWRQSREQRRLLVPRAEMVTFPSMKRARPADETRAWSTSFMSFLRRAFWGGGGVETQERDFSEWRRLLISGWSQMEAGKARRGGDIFNTYPRGFILTNARVIGLRLFRYNRKRKKLSFESFVGKCPLYLLPMLDNFSSGLFSPGDARQLTIQFTRHFGNIKPTARTLVFQLSTWSCS